MWEAMHIEYLTREGSADTPLWLERLREAIGNCARFDAVDVGRLHERDPRRGYEVPTVLVDGEDLFGAKGRWPSTAPPPQQEPAAAVPTVAEIRAALARFGLAVDGRH